VNQFCFVFTHIAFFLLLALKIADLHVLPGSCLPGMPVTAFFCRLVRTPFLRACGDCHGFLMIRLDADGLCSKYTNIADAINLAIVVRIITSTSPLARGRVFVVVQESHHTPTSINERLFRMAWIVVPQGHARGLCYLHNSISTGAIFVFGGFEGFVVAWKPQNKKHRKMMIMTAPSRPTSHFLANNNESNGTSKTDVQL
jgi:hypothetical protein